MITLDWIGGFFDGDGDANVYSRKSVYETKQGKKTSVFPYPVVRISQLDRGILDEINGFVFDKVGVRGGLCKDKRTGVHQLAWEGAKARVVAKLLCPFSVIKRENLLKVKNNKPKGRNQYKKLQ